MNCNYILDSEKDPTIGFTGTRNGMTPAQKLAVFKWLNAIKGIGSLDLHHGCAVGADAEAHAIALELGYRVHGWPSWKPDTALYGFAAVHDRMAPLTRNLRIVQACDVLLAAPSEPEEQPRGGTWSTVRAARRRGVCVVVVLPDGSVRHFY